MSDDLRDAWDARSIRTWFEEEVPMKQVFEDLMDQLLGPPNGVRK